MSQERCGGSAASAIERSGGTSPSRRTRAIPASSSEAAAWRAARVSSDTTLPSRAPPNPPTPSPSDAPISTFAMTRSPVRGSSAMFASVMAAVSPLMAPSAPAPSVAPSAVAAPSPSRGANRSTNAARTVFPNWFANPPAVIVAAERCARVSPPVASAGTTPPKMRPAVYAVGVAPRKPSSRASCRSPSSARSAARSWPIVSSSSAPMAAPPAELSAPTSGPAFCTCSRTLCVYARRLSSCRSVSVSSRRFGSPPAAWSRMICACSGTDGSSGTVTTVPSGRVYEVTKVGGTYRSSTICRPARYALRAKSTPAAPAGLMSQEGSSIPCSGGCGVCPRWCSAMRARIRGLMNCPPSTW